MEPALEKTASELSDIERKTLAALTDTKPHALDEIADDSGLPLDSVRRAVAWLSEKKLIQTRTNSTTKWRLSAAGNSSLSNGLPEKLFIEALQSLGGKANLEQVYQKSQLNRPEFNAAMGLAKKNAWISIQKKGEQLALELTGLEKDLLNGKYGLEQFLHQLKKNAQTEHIDLVLMGVLKKRGLVEEETKTDINVQITAQGIRILPLFANTAKRSYDVTSGVPDLSMGKKQPYREFLRSVAQRLTEMGFAEMDSPLVTQEFYNFDALFQPQNHPARSRTDTYQLSAPATGQLPDKKIVSAVKASHAHGGNTGSRGWGYDWSEEIAKRVMPAAHATAHSARQMVKGIQVPGKYYSISRCFRPDVVDATHLIEFNQMDGFVVDERLNFPQLLGLLKEFAIEFAGAKAVKFAPSYYPFTEPSVQINALHPKLGWMELGGAGIFRPELTVPLGIHQPVLAWGIGIDRLAMIKLNISDIRYLFSDDLDWLRKQKGVMLE
ncbi:MAG: phenylalanine--tRNA ligase subunit alpha [Candidatus Diapherotrites archaeon]|nr:phenylalanine--tRNA ligase subunit alpha [Candidatus Diapherotrites archaeon]